MAGFWDFYHRAQPHMEARASNGFSSGVDDVRHKLIEEGWFGRQTTGNIAQKEVPEIAPAAIEPAGTPPIAAQGTAPMHDTSFSYASWYQRQNPTGQPVATDTIHGETRTGDSKAADLYGSTPPVAPEGSSKAAGVTMHDEAAWNREVRSSDLYGPATPAEPSPPTPAQDEPDHEPGY